MITGKELTIEEAYRLNPLALAHIGDCIFDLYVRVNLLLEENTSAGKLHSSCIKIVNAKNQSEFAKKVLATLTEREHDIFMRGRNAKSATTPKNMSVADYKYATAIEAVFGYLYLTGQKERINQLFEQLNIHGNISDII